MSYNPKVVSFDRSSAYMHHRAMVNRRENNPVDALELLRRAVEHSPDNQEYRLDLAELYCEMGCHEQSSRLLLDMLAQKDAPAECYYGLALNQLGMNDLEGAKESLRKYRQADPEGAHAEDVSRLASELDIFDALNRPSNRRLYRAMRVADDACTALQEGENEKAKRLFERSLSLSTEQYEMRAMYAMALMLCGEDEAALREAKRASEGFPPSARALCVASQVLAALEHEDEAKVLLKRVMEERPSGVELRLLIFSLGELGMHAEIAECARLALQETPFDKQLLHIRAAALHNLGMPDGEVGKFWRRILRIDPQDSVAQFYQSSCERGELSANAPGYVYQVPEEECLRRTLWLAGQFDGGLSGAKEKWLGDPDFRQTVLWATQSDDEKLRRAAVTVIAAMEDEAAGSSIRALMFGGEIQHELKRHAAALLKLRGADVESFFPSQKVVEGTLLPETAEVLEGLPVGDRQLIRYAGEVLEAEYDISARTELALMWAVYRMKRGVRFDPLTNSEAAAAALVYNFLLMRGTKTTIDALSGQFGCSKRRMVFYARRIADVLERS